MKRVVYFIDDYYPKFYICLRFSDFRYITRRLDKKKVPYTYQDYSSLEAMEKGIFK